MKSIKVFRHSTLMLFMLALIAGCASTPSERELKMPGWFEGFEDEEAKETAKEEDYSAESSADASDRISKDDTEAPLSEDELIEGPTSPVDSEPDGSTVKSTASATEQDQQPESEEPEVEPPPQPKPLVAKNEQHALEAQQARPRYEQALKKMRDGDLEAALLLFQELSAEFPTLSGPVVNQAIILRKQNKLEQAKAVLQKALLNKAQNPYLMNEMGLVYRQLGKFEAAKQAYLSAIRIEPNYDKAHYNLAVLADLYLHDPVLALEEFKIYQSLQTEPDKKVAGWLKEIERRIP